MPANKKYLSSGWQRFAKITAGLIGGYLVTISLHLGLALWFDHANILITVTFSGFILWATFMILAFLSRNGWKIWVVYLLATLIFGGSIYVTKTWFPTALYEQTRT